MTRTSVSFRPDPNGFTLLEMLVVLVIMGMAVAVIGPRLQNTYDAVTRSGERADVIKQLQNLPLIARDAKGLDLAAGSPDLMRHLPLPEGWQAVTESALHIEASGFCHPAIISLKPPGNAPAQRVALAEPDCGVSDAR